MSYRETFKKIIDLIKEEKTKKSQDSTLEIEETKKSAHLKSVKIVYAGTSSFSIKFDECGFPGTAAFRSHDSLQKACDSISFCEHDGKPYILFFELKSSEPNINDVAKQFRSAHCFIEYLDIILNSYYHINDLSSWERRYFVFHIGKENPASKKPLKPQQPSNTTPEKPKFIPTQNNSKININKLLMKDII